MDSVHKFVQSTSCLTKTKIKNTTKGVNRKNTGVNEDLKRH